MFLNYTTPTFTLTFSDNQVDLTQANQVFVTFKGNIEKITKTGNDLTVQEYTDKAQAQNKLYRLWAYGANPDQGETRQYFSATMTEYNHGNAILLEAKVFDYREPEPPVNEE